MTLTAQVCIIGLGPAGLAAALETSRRLPGRLVVCIEAGPPAAEKFCTVLQGRGCRRAEPCHIIGGVGGCALLAGGKISDYPAGRALSGILGSPELAKAALGEALEELGHYLPMIPPSAREPLPDQAIMRYTAAGLAFRYYDAYLYRHSDFVTACTTMLAELEESGVQVPTRTRVATVEVRGSHEFEVICFAVGEEVRVHTQNVVLATGRLGKDLLKAIDIANDLGGSPNFLDIGVRLEFPSNAWTVSSSCHNDLKLHFGTARTFCVCIDGVLAPYRLGDAFLLEGLSDPDLRSGFTNLGITVRCAAREGFDPQETIDEVLRRQRNLSKGFPIGRASIASSMRVTRLVRSHQQQPRRSTSGRREAWRDASLPPSPRRSWNRSGSLHLLRSIQLRSLGHSFSAPRWTISGLAIQYPPASRVTSRLST